MNGSPDRPKEHSRLERTARFDWEMEALRTYVLWVTLSGGFLNQQQRIAATKAVTAKLQKHQKISERQIRQIITGVLRRKKI